MNEQALKDRLKTIARLENRSFQEVWKSLTLERLLVRLARSNYHDQFIFKGGLLLSHYLFIGRETIDIDLLIKKMQAEASKLTQAFTEISNTLVNDGFTMTFADINALDHTHMNHPGFRVTLNVRFGKIKDRIQIDVGTGDIVKPKKVALSLYQYKGQPIFEDAISLQIYPVETIFAEKLETIVYRGATNSRMKDFHDVLLLCRQKDLIDINLLKANIDAVFNHRHTQQLLPLNYSKSEYTKLQVLWNAHLRKLGDLANRLKLPNEFSILIKEINTWLTTVYNNEVATLS